MNKCIDCKKEIYRYSIRCKSCAKKGELHPFFNKKRLDQSQRMKLNNPVNNLKIRQKISQTRINKSIAKGKSNPNYKDGNTLVKHYCIDCGNEINYQAIRCEQCNYINFKELFKGKNNPMFGKITHSKGAYYSNIWMRSSWEIFFAKWCDRNNIKWLYEPKTFDLGNTTYTPDFYLPEFNLYIEIKGYWRDDARKKFRLFKKLYKNIKIQILDKTYFRSIKEGIKE